jgi:hypothetical protein
LEYNTLPRRLRRHGNRSISERRRVRTQPQRHVPSSIDLIARQAEPGRDRRRGRVERLLDELLEGLDFSRGSGPDELPEEAEESEEEIVEHLPVWMGRQPNWLIGTYDPFSSNFPRSDAEVEWGLTACRWVMDNLSTEEDWDRMVDLICEPFEWDQYAIRTKAWFYALEFDEQVEVLLQRHFDKRPGSKWIIGPHDEILPEWEWRITHRECRILDIEYPGCEGGYLLAHEMTPGSYESSLLVEQDALWRPVWDRESGLDEDLR